MDLVGLLDSDVAKLPMDGADNLEQLLQDRFNAYIAEVSQLDTSDPPGARVRSAQAEIQQLGLLVIAALRRWMNAEPDQALGELSGGIQLVENSIGQLTTEEVPAGHTGPLFRVRVGDPAKNWTPGELFHVPFESHDRISSKRYSFPGFPCLYLGRSVYVCWRELGRPNFNDLWISKFELNDGQTLRVLDFGHRPASVAAGLDHAMGGQPGGFPPDMAAAYAILWPLIAGCSVRRQSGRLTHFVIEYVIPQLLLRWLIRRMRLGYADHRIDGIRYFSTHIEDNNVGIAGINYVLPAQDRQPSSYCPVLRAKFRLTPPANWQIAMSGQFAPPHAPFNQVTFELTPGWEEQYIHTQFHRVESFVNQIGAVSV